MTRRRTVQTRYTLRRNTASIMKDLIWNKKLNQPIKFHSTSLGTDLMLYCWVLMFLKKVEFCMQIFFQKSNVCNMLTTSSVAMFFVLLRPIFWEKWKIAPPFENSPPSNDWICEIGRKIRLDIGEDLFFLEITWFWAEKTFEFWISAEKTLSILVETFFFFFFFFFFGDHLILGGKNLWIFELSETFRLNFRTNRLKLLLDQWKFQSRSFAHFSLFQNSPPPFPNPGNAPAYYRIVNNCTTFVRAKI